MTTSLAATAAPRNLLLELMVEEMSTRVKALVEASKTPTPSAFNGAR